MSGVSQSSCNDLHACRSLWDIYYACFTTIFICTWVSLRPNVPAYGANCWHVLRTRVKLMVVAIIFPDIILLWAIKQYYAARQVSNSPGEFILV